MVRAMSLALILGLGNVTFVYALDKPEFFGVYVALSTGTNIQLKAAHIQGGAAFTASGNIMQVLEGENRYSFIGQQTQTTISRAELKGFIIYLDKVSVQPIRFNSFASVKDFAACSHPVVTMLINDKVSSFLGQDMAWIDTRFGIGSESFNIKKLGDDMFYLEPGKDGLDINKGDWVYKPYKCESREVASFIGIRVDNTYYTFALTPSLIEKEQEAKEKERYYTKPPKFEYGNLANLETALKKEEERISEINFIKRSSLRRSLKNSLFEQALEIDPKNFEAHHKLGKVYLAGNEYAAALTHLLEAVNLMPSNPEPYGSMIEFYKRLGMDDAAQEWTQARGEILKKQ